MEEFLVGVINLYAWVELDFGGCRAFKTITENFENLTKVKMLCMFELEALEEFPVGVSYFVAMKKLKAMFYWELNMIQSTFSGDM